MLRETQFGLGGALVIAAGAAFLVALAWSGAGVEYLGGWLGGALAIGFGGFFVYVARAEARARRAWLDGEAREASGPGSGDRPPP
jgi:hypothetical protein